MRYSMIIGLLTACVSLASGHFAQAATPSAAIGISATVVSVCSISTATPTGNIGRPANVNCSYNTTYSVSQVRGTTADLQQDGGVLLSYSNAGIPNQNVMITTVTY